MTTTPEQQEALNRGLYYTIVDGMSDEHDWYADVPYSKVRKALEKGADPNMEFGAWKTRLLHMVPYYGWSVADVDDLIKRGARVDEPSRTNVTPLMTAASHRNGEKLAFFFLKKGADITRVDDRGNNLTGMAAASGHVHLLDECLARGVPTISASTGQHGNRSALIGAVHSKAPPRVIARLIDSGMNLDHQHISEQNNTALTIAARDVPEIACMLMDAGADPSIKCSEGNAFAMAKRNVEHRPKGKLVLDYQNMPHLVLSKPGRVQKLLSGDKQFERKEQLFERNSHGFTLLDTPETWHRFGEVTTRMKQAGQELATRELQGQNRDGKTWLRRAVECFSADPVFSYLEKNNDLPAKEAFFAQANDGSTMFASPAAWVQLETLLDVARKKGDPFTKADFLRKDGNGRSLLELAVEGGKIGAVLSYLDQRGDGLNGRDIKDNPGFSIALIKFNDTPQLFKASAWQGQNPHRMKEVFHSLPEEAQAQVDNYHQLLAQLQRQPRHTGKAR